MEIKAVEQTSVNDYIKFCREVYNNNIYYRDSMSASLRSILTAKAEICKSSIIKPIMIIDSGKIVAVCVFVIVDRMKDTLQIAYFEALENQEKAVEKIMDYGRQLAKEYHAEKILVGLNLHVNYGLGLLASHYEEVQSFGSSYNPPYYIDYFEKYTDEKINLVSYKAKMDNFDFGVADRIMNKIKKKYNVRKADFKDIKGEAEIYTHLNNHAFRCHKFYYERRLEEDLELFREFKLLLREENLLFLEYEGRPIGFMLWYPDFNELLEPSEALGLKTVIKNKLFSRKIKKFKIVEIGVLPEFQKNGAVLALFYQCREIVKDRYQVCESGWILEDNLASRGFGFRWGNQESKHYQVFLINV